MKKIFLISIIFILSIFYAKSQDILASIHVSSNKVEGTDRGIYEAMSKALNDLVNGRNWTPYQLKQDERFRIRISINVTERRSDTEFDGEISVAMSRVVFNTNYESPILNFIDRKLHFYYNQFEPLDYVETTYTSNLVSVVAFYIYYALGLQFDTFQPSGGQEFFTKANTVVHNAQSSREAGWASQDGDRSRYWLIEYIMSPTYSGLRTFMYQYHRQGLDVMADNIEGGRTYIVRAIETLKRVYEERPGMYVTQMIIDAKRDEIINIFRDASDSEKKNIVDMMKQIDAANSSKYDGINTSSSSSSSYPSGNSSFPQSTTPSSNYGGQQSPSIKR